jgi:hypothetical protein
MVSQPSAFLAHAPAIHPELCRGHSAYELVATVARGYPGERLVHAAATVVG